MRYIIESNSSGESLPIAAFICFDDAYTFALTQHKLGADVKLIDTEEDNDVVVTLTHTRV
jgi:hypothetical protein